MAISILYNIPSLAAENQLNISSAALQKTLYALSTGSRINSGADDAAGLAIANSMNANVTALTQSAQNASTGIDKLQVADGALSQVTSLLNRAVTLATESANGDLNDSQRGALDAEFSAIKAEIDRIGSNTTYNGTQIFQNQSNGLAFSSATAGTPLSMGTALAAGNTFELNVGGTPDAYVYTTTASSTVGSLIANINASGLGLNASLSNGQLVVSDLDNRNNLAVDAANTNIAEFSATVGTIQGAVTDTYLSDSTSFGSSDIAAMIETLSQSQIADGTGTSNVDLSADNLTTGANSKTALDDINTAIANIASQRGTLGAAMNRLTSATNVVNNQLQNLTSAENDITAADIPTEVANLTKYQILNQTGISALAQANQMQQIVLKLLQ